MRVLRIKSVSHEAESRAPGPRSIATQAVGRLQRVLAIDPVASCSIRMRQFELESDAVWGGRWPRSDGAPAGFSIRSIPAQSSRSARFCESGWADREVPYRAAAPASRRGKEASYGHGESRLFRVSAMRRL